MAYIGKEPIVGNFQKCDAITVVNGQAAYTLQVSSTNVVPESANHMLVSLNGILQAPVTSFTVSSSTLTFASNLATGDVIDFVILLGNVLDLGTPSDGTVTNAKLAQDIISGETELAVAPAATDEFLVSDAGVLKRVDASLVGKGKVLQVVQTHKSDTTSTTSESFEDMSGMTVDITPSATSSKILVLISLGGIGSAVGVSTQTIKLVRESTSISIGDAASSRTRTSFSTGPRGDGNHMTNAHYSYLDSPSSTSEQTYKLQWFTQNASGGTTKTGYLNRTGGDSDDDNAPYSRGASSIIVMEIGA
jgi:hypothetical protein